MRKREDSGGRAGGLGTGPPPTCLMGSPLRSPSFPETLQDSLLLSCCCLKPARYFVGPSPAPTQSSTLGVPWAPWSWICPYLHSSPGWPLSLSQINLSTYPSGTDHHECAVTLWEGGPHPQPLSMEAELTPRCTPSCSLGHRWGSSGAP